MQEVIEAPADKLERKERRTEKKKYIECAPEKRTRGGGSVREVLEKTCHANGQPEEPAKPVREAYNPHLETKTALPLIIYQRQNL